MAFTLSAFEAVLETTAQRHLRRCPSNLRQSILYSLLLPGKRIRPKVMHSVGLMLDLPESTTLQAGAALEMIHCFSLIHDDLPCMDNDDFRRGKPSNHKAHGEALALLAGDSLASLGPISLLDLRGTVPADRLTLALARLHLMVGPEGMIGGQAAELLLTQKSSESDVRGMHALKTGALFLASVLIPADLAGVSEGSPQWKVLDRFGQSLGSAFQIADDLQDATQDQERKSVSILSHLSPAQAAHRAEEDLQTSLQGLRAHWPKNCGPVLEVAGEVLNFLHTTGASS